MLTHVPGVYCRQTVSVTYVADFVKLNNRIRESYSVIL